MSTTPASATHPDDMALARAWAEAHLQDAADLPISFSLDGQPQHGIPAGWEVTSSAHRIDANIVETVYIGRDPASSLTLRVVCTAYQDYPVREWLAWFSNDGLESSPLISEIQGLDADFLGASPTVEHCNGDFYSAAGYEAEETPLSPGQVYTAAPKGGRACDSAFPYYRIAFGGYGTTLAIGWPAQWAAEFVGSEAGIHIRAGQELTHLRLLPGETVRTPRITLLWWQGGRERAVNLWRRWYLAHILPRPDGRPLAPALVACGPGDGEEFTGANEQNQIEFMDKTVERGLPFDVWWIDAGWYPCYDAKHERHWPLTGTWQPDPERFSNGFAPVSERAAREGADLLVWFEPERVVPGSELDIEHPEWLLTATGSSSKLLNLGITACRTWLTERVCGIIQEGGIGIYRQDHNFEPLKYWRENDTPERRGLSENLHVQGYLQYWDDLLSRNPGLWIDSCASGGRRNDLETMRRSVPLHYSDFGYGDHPIKLAFHNRLHEWLPYFKECTLSWDLGGPTRFDHVIDSFSFYCAMAPMLFPTYDIRRDDYDYAEALRMMTVWRRAAPLILSGDYYALSAFEKRADAWLCWQFDDPEAGTGMLQAVRLPGAPGDNAHPIPHALRPDALYRFESSETGERRVLSGADVMCSGLNIELSPRSGVIWFYRIA